MLNIHKFFEKVVVGIIAFIFVFTATYVVQPYSQVKQAEAAGVAGFVYDAANFAEGVFLNATALATKASAAVSAWAEAYLQSKESILDGLAWAAAKYALAAMTTSIVNWINSGFEGSPSFVQDLDRFLLDVADRTFGEYLAQTADLAFLCDPFRLDVRITLATIQANTRDNTAPACTLTGVLEDIQSFMSGNFNDGGWDAWLQITTQPETYTAYGQYLKTQSLVDAKVAEAQREESDLLGYGGGFLSSRICESVGGEGNLQNCVISTPGKVIQEALNFQLTTGPESLIAADEINEVIAALFTYLAQEAITGASGLLGLSGGTGYTYEGYESGSYLGDMQLEMNIDSGRFEEILEEGIATETLYRDAAIRAYPLLLEYAATSSPAEPARKENARDEANRIINRLLPTTNENVAALTRILASWRALPDNETTETSRRRQELIGDYSALRLHQEDTVDADILNWERIIREIEPAETDSEEEEERANEAQETLDRIEENTEDD